MRGLYCRGWASVARLPFRRKLLLSLVLLSLIVIVLIGALFAGVFSQVLLRTEKDRLSQFVQIVNEDLSSQMSVFNVLGMDLVISAEVRQALNPPDDMAYSKGQQAISAALKSKSLSTRGLQNLCVLDTDGNVCSTRISLLLPPDFRLEDSGVYAQAAVGKGALVWLTDNDLFDRYGAQTGMYSPGSDLHAAAVIEDYSRKRVMGLLLLTLQKDYFQNITYSGELIDGTNLYLVSPDKGRVYTVSGTTAALEDAVLEGLDFGLPGGTRTLGRSVVSFLKNEAMGWYLVSTTDTHILSQSLGHMRTVLLLTLAAALAIAAVFTRILTQALTAGMDEMMAGMARVEGGDFDVALDVRRRDEFGQLAAAFNHMVVRIRDLIIARYQQELMAREAEFRSLQAQINPHFLYNTLDMLNWKLAGRGQEDLSEDVVSIAELLRYSMSREPRDVPLSEELKNVEDYIRVQCSISGKHVEVSIHAEDAERILFPRLTLQPLVENAVLHGFHGRTEDNLLSISGRHAEGGGYCLEVIDNGVGIPEEVLVKLNDAGDSGEHIGIHNVRARIRYLYGPEAAVLAESQYGFGACICIHIPGKGERT